MKLTAVKAMSIQKFMNILIVAGGILKEGFDFFKYLKVTADMLLIMMFLFHIELL